MSIFAQLRNLKTTPRKTRLVVDLIRGKSVEEAERLLTFSSKEVAKPLLKLLRSAIASADLKKLSKDRLYIQTLTATAGATLKRFKPQAFGRANVVRKRWSHVRLTLEERPQPAAPKAKIKTTPPPSSSTKKS